MSAAQQPSTWPEGFRRPKTEGDLVAQIVWGAVGVIGLVAACASGMPVLGAIFLLSGLLSMVWVEFQARCEDRTLVWTAFGAIMVLGALWAARNRRNAQRYFNNPNS